MVMGFMLPFALAFAAIPLESFIHSGRIVLGGLTTVALRSFAGLLEFMGKLCKNLGPVLTHIYDFLIVIPLKLEQLITRRGSSHRQSENY